VERNHRRVKERIIALKKQWQREGRACTYCGITLRYDQSGLPDSVEADHVYPVSLGGHVLGEMIPSCRFHNQSRGNKSVEEFTRMLEDECNGKRIKGKGIGTTMPKDIPDVKRPLLW
jgi:5-methylcytosine-specific restriction endonuclease McrA